MLELTIRLLLVEFVSAAECHCFDLIGRYLAFLKLFQIKSACILRAVPL